MMKSTLKILFGVLVFFSTIQAQSSSVYSRYGIGDVEYGYSPKMIGIGDIGVTQLDSGHVLTTNPASWSSFDKTRMEFSLGYKGISLSDNSQSVFTSETEFKGVTLGIPISQKYGVGVAVGLVPYTRISYKSIGSYTSPDESAAPSYNISYEGSGGLSKLFVGSSVYLPLDFSVGITLDYYFGNQRYFSNIEFVDNTNNINTSYENNRRSTGFGSTVGIISPNLASKFNLKTFSDLRVGLSVNYISDLNADSILSSTSSTLVDTIHILNGSKMKIPTRINGGISFVFDKVYNVILDYAYQPWSKFEFNGMKNNNLRDAQKLSLAFEYMPRVAMGMSVWEQMSWRGGVSYEESQYVFNGQGINQYSLFGGFSFPLDVDNTIDIAAQFSIRGTKDFNLLREEFVKLYIGISFGELWFLPFEK